MFDYDFSTNRPFPVVCDIIGTVGECLHTGRNRRKMKGMKFLKYKNAKKILPEDLIETIQQYVQGEYIYIPIKEKI